VTAVDFSYRRRGKIVQCCPSPRVVVATFGRILAASASVASQQVAARIRLGRFAWTITIGTAAGPAQPETIIRLRAGPKKTGALKGTPRRRKMRHGNHLGTEITKLVGAQHLPFWLKGNKRIKYRLNSQINVLMFMTKMF